MQKIRIKKIWDNQSKKFIDSYEVQDREKIITGKVDISTKKDDKYISKTLPFIAFKSKIDQGMINCLLTSNNKLFDAEFNIMVDSFADENGEEKKYLKLVINKAILNSDNNNSNTINQEQIVDDEIPF